MLILDMICSICHDMLVLSFLSASACIMQFPLCSFYQEEGLKIMSWRFSSAFSLGALRGPGQGGKFNLSLTCRARFTSSESQVTAAFVLFLPHDPLYSREFHMVWLESGMDWEALLPVARENWGSALVILFLSAKRLLCAKKIRWRDLWSLLLFNCIKYLYVIHLEEVIIGAR